MQSLLQSRIFQSNQMNSPVKMWRDGQCKHLTRINTILYTIYIYMIVYRICGQVRSHAIGLGWTVYHRLWEAHDAQHNRGSIVLPHYLKPLNIVLVWCWRKFSAPSEWIPLMSKHAILSSGYTNWVAGAFMTQAPAHGPDWKNKNRNDTLVTKFIFLKTKIQITCNSHYCLSYMFHTRCRNLI